MTPVQTEPTTAPTPAWIESLADRSDIVDDAVLATLLVERGAALGTMLRREPLERIRKTSISDIVTAADHAAEEEIVAALTALRPDDGILGEEGAARESRNGRQWIIDPIDGTYNYAHEIGNWCSAIALRDNDGGLLGAVRRELTDETWVGGVTADGRPSTQLNGRLLTPMPDLPLEQICLATYLHPARIGDPNVLEPWLAAARGPATIRVLGSGSCDLAAVATGRLGAFMQSGTADWDWYPGLALVLGAGGHAQVLHHRGYRWHLAGGERTVRALADLLTSA